MESISWSELFDIGFVLFVCLALVYLCRTSNSALEEKSQRWKNELETLEKSLRSLIQEAANASRSLDQILLKRQEQLTSLLSQLNSLDTNHEIPIISLTEQEVVNDLPNESWLKPKARQTQEKATAKTNHTPLAQQIEVAKQDQKPAPQDSVDEHTVAQRVAIRLLEQGQEIHVVARKLNLELETVRTLDRARIAANQKTAPKAATNFKNESVPNLISPELQINSWQLE